MEKSKHDDQHRDRFRKDKNLRLLRHYCISVRLNQAELELLNNRRGKHKKGEWLRLTFLNHTPTDIPLVNVEAWKMLSDISQKLNRIAIHIDGKSKDSKLTNTELFAVRRQIVELRQHLLNADIWSKSDEGYAEDKRGKSFAGVVQYALKPGAHHKSDPIIIGGNMLGDSALELIAEFDSTKHLRQDVAKSVWHNSLRLPNGESLTNEQWSSIADDYMKRMGFSDTHLRCYVLHDDEGQHIHIIASRIDIASGKLYLGRNENLISTRIISELEITHNLTVTMTAPKQPKRRKVSRNEQMLSDGLAFPPPKKLSNRYLIKVYLISRTF